MIEIEELLPGGLPFFSSDGSFGEKGGTDPNSWFLTIPFTSGSEAFEAIIRFVRMAEPHFATGKVPADATTSRSEKVKLRFLREIMDGAVLDLPVAKNFAVVAVDLTLRRPRPRPSNAIG